MDTVTQAVSESAALLGAPAGWRRMTVAVRDLRAVEAVPAVEVETAEAWRVSWLELDDQGRAFGGVRSLVVVARDSADAVEQARESGLMGGAGAVARVVAVRREGGGL